MLVFSNFFLFTGSLIFFKQNLLVSLFTYYIIFNGYYNYDDYDTSDNIDIYIVNAANKK